MLVLKYIGRILQYLLNAAVKYIGCSSKRIYNNNTLIIDKLIVF